MALRLRFVLMWLVLSTGAASLWAASKAEEKAFGQAAQSFSDHGWARAEREFDEFRKQYPDSEHLVAAMLYQAEARIRLKNFAGAIQLLTEGQPPAGEFADEYLFWLAEAQLQGGQPEIAAGLYAQFITKFPTSRRVLEAVVGEAAARSQLQQWAQVTGLLQNPEGLFQKLTQASPAQPAAVRGRFLLAEAEQALEHYAGAEQALAPLLSAPIGLELGRERDILLGEIQRADHRPEEALGMVTNLLPQVTNQPVVQARVLALVGRCREDLHQPDQAIAAWSQNLAATAPPERRREAALRVGDLLLGQGRVADAAQTIEQFLASETNAPSLDVAWLTLGELRLRQFVLTNAPTATNETTVTTNLLPQALAAFDTVIGQLPRSALVGRAQLGRGWCFWLDGKYAESGAAFAQAAADLPASLEQATARFKLADTLAEQKDFAGALTNYEQVVATGDDIPAVRGNLVERSLYQVLKMAREVKDDAAANAAMARLLEDFPGGSLVQPALLAFGQSADRADPAERRGVLEGFLQRSPGSKLAAGVRLAVARTYEQEQDWTNAAAAYTSWLEDYTNAPSAQRDEFLRAGYLRALDTARSGNESNALVLFTNFVAQYPTNEYAPLAQWWVADHYWRQEDFFNAERNYQLLYLNNPQSPLRYEARLMAGRAAFERRPEEALSYFTNLTSDVKCPPEIDAQALFAFGDTLAALEPAGTNQTPANFEEAISRFSLVTARYPDTKIAVRAQGRIGDCYLQLGGGATNQSAAMEKYSQAIGAYKRVLTNSLADVAARSQAEVGLGIVLEKEAALLTGTNQTALVQQALDHYLNVVYGKVSADESSDPFWVKEAGLKALRAAEALQDWDRLGKLCDTLEKLLPPLEPLLEKKKARAAEMSGKTVD